MEQPSGPQGSGPTPRATAPALLRAVAARVEDAADHGLDRLLHPRRRRAALARLSGRLPHRVVFICHGNVIRSPFAACLAARVLPPELRGRVEIASAGFVGAGRPPPQEAIETAALWGIDLSPHRSSLLSPDDVRGAGLVVVAEPEQGQSLRRRFGIPDERLLVLGDLDPDAIETRAIRDPAAQPRHVCIESYGRIARCIRALVEAWTPRSPSACGPIEIVTGPE